MHILNILPQRLDAGATPTFAGILGTNGQSILGNSSGAWAITANGTNQNITLTPSGTGMTANMGGGYFTGSGTPANGSTGGLEITGDNTQANVFAYRRGVGALPLVLQGAGSVVLIGTSTNSGALLQIGTNTTNLAGGMIFGTDVGFFRSGANALSFSHVGGTNPVFQWVEGTTGRAQLGTNSGEFYIDTLTAGKSIFLRSGNQTLALTLDSSQGMNHSGSTVVFNGAAAGAVTSSTRFRKAVTAIANASATAVLTVTIPNAAHSASLNVYLTGSLGAGGAIGANEASAAIGYTIAISRTAGVNAVAVASTAFGSATAAVAGAATCTITAVVSAISGAVGAANTFTVNVTISRGSGSSANHTCQVTAELDNANASGITLA